MTNGKWQTTNNKWQYAGLWLQLQLSFVLSSNQRGGGWWLEEARGEVSTMMVLGGNNVLGNNVLGNTVLGNNVLGNNVLGNNVLGGNNTMF